MHFLATLTSSLLLASGALAQAEFGASPANSGSNSGSSQSSIVAPSAPSSTDPSSSGMSGMSGSYGSSGSSGSSSSSSGSSGSSSSSGSSGSSGSSAGSGQVMVQVVKVGSKNGSLTFEPNDIKAQPGSMVQFHFWPKNHSVVQSAFTDPCVPINNIQSNVTGFFSGYMPVAADAKEMPSYTIMVNSTGPIWFYCSQGKHCQAGMVGVINAPGGEKTLDAYKSKAAAAAENLAPGASSGSGSGGYGTGSGSGTDTSGSGSSGSGTDASATDSAPSSTDSAAPVSTGAASGSIFSGARTGFTVAGLLSALFAVAL